MGVVLSESSPSFANSSRSSRSLLCATDSGVILSAKHFSPSLMICMSLSELAVKAGPVSKSDCSFPGNKRAISGRHASHSGSRTRTRSRSSLAASICCVYDLNSVDNHSKSVKFYLKFIFYS